jgi:hypothetical protein
VFFGLRFGGLGLRRLIEVSDVRLQELFIFWFQVWSLIGWSEVRWENAFKFWFVVRGLG